MTIIPFSPEHAGALDIQAAQVHYLSVMTPQFLSNLERLGPAYSAIIDGRLMGSAGILDTGLGTGVLWALVHKDAGRHFVPLFRAVQRLKTLVRLRRLEATVEVGFAPGCRALELLGFVQEGRMAKYGPDGADHIRYAYVA